MRGRRAPLTIFDRGPDIATLRERCLADTGLPAPRQPVWPGQLSAA
jgi:N-methylhydantoinase B